MNDRSLVAGLRTQAIPRSEQRSLPDERDLIVAICRINSAEEEHQVISDLRFSLTLILSDEVVDLGFVGKRLHPVAPREVVFELLQGDAPGLGHDKQVEAQGYDVDDTEGQVGPRGAQMADHDGEQPRDDRVHHPAAAHGKALGDAADAGGEDLGDQHPVDGAGLLGEHEEGHEDEDQPRQIRRNLGRNTPVGQRVGTDAESENEGEGE